MTITVETKFDSYDSSYLSMLLGHYFILGYITYLVLRHFVQEPLCPKKPCRIIINLIEDRVADYDRK